MFCVHLVKRCCLAGAAILIALVQPGQASDTRPDIIVVLTDDIGAGVINQGGYSTPTITGIAAQGIRYTSAHGAPLCTPGRVMALTGRWPSDFGISNNNPILPAATANLGSVLKAAGYRTAMIGKWHVNRVSPLDQGFDRFYGWLKTGAPYFGDSPDVPLYDQRARASNAGYITDELAARALEFLAAPGDEPKFLYFAPNAAHAPLPYGPADLLARAPAQLKDYDRRRAAAILGLDDALARVLAAAPDALVVFSSDNSQGANGQLRGNKGTPFEGGVTVPLYVRWPGRLPAGVIDPTPVSLVDLLPTLAEAAGAPAPEGLDGVSLLEPVPEGRGLLYAALRFEGWGVRRGQYKLLRDYDGVPVRLFDLQVDPGERHNIAGGRSSLVGELTQLLEAIR